MLGQNLLNGAETGGEGESRDIGRAQGELGAFCPQALVRGPQAGQFGFIVGNRRHAVSPLSSASRLLLDFRQVVEGDPAVVNAGREDNLGDRLAEAALDVVDELVEGRRRLEDHFQ